jgi:hypothetical protein
LPRIAKPATQDHLSTLSEALSLRLSYFSILPTSTSFLNSPSVTLVLSPDFLHTLDRLDVGLEFVQAHPQYKDAALYRMRFEHCVVRAGQLIRLYLVQRMQQLVQETGDGLKKWEKERYGKGAAEKSQASADSKLQVSARERLCRGLHAHLVAGPRGSGPARPDVR